MSQENKQSVNDADVKQPVQNRAPSPQPSTSAASIPPTQLRSSVGSTERLSVYSHIKGIETIGHLGGFRYGRRRSQFRGFRKTKILLKYSEAMNILEPIFAEENLRLEEAHALIAAAIENFAITVSGIVDQLEGKEPQNEYAEKLQKFKKKAEADRARRVEEGAPIVSEAVRRTAATLSESQLQALRLESTLQLEETAAAAIEALSSGDRKGEQLPSLLHFVGSSDSPGERLPPLLHAAGSCSRGNPRLYVRLPYEHHSSSDDE